MLSSRLVDAGLGQQLLGLLRVVRVQHVVDVLVVGEVPRRERLVGDHALAGQQRVADALAVEAVQQRLAHVDVVLLGPGPVLDDVGVGELGVEHQPEGRIVLDLGHLGGADRRGLICPVRTALSRATLSAIDRISRFLTLARWSWSQ